MSRQNEAGVLMGYRSTIELVILINCVVCFLFFIQSIFMISSSRHSLRMANAVKRGEDLKDYKEGMVRLE